MINYVSETLKNLIPKYRHDWFALVGLYLAVEAIIYTFINTQESALFWIASGVFWSGSALYQANELKRNR